MDGALFLSTEALPVNAPEIIRTNTVPIKTPTLSEREAERQRRFQGLVRR